MYVWYSVLEPARCVLFSYYARIVKLHAFYAMYFKACMLCWYYCFYSFP
jgi:hypothetical protein